MSDEATTATPATPKPKIIDLLMEALLAKYSPTGSDKRVELKSTIDLLDEMEPVAQIEKWEIRTALELSGFKPRYTEAGFLWQLFLR